MATRKPTYEELEQRVRELGEKALECERAKEALQESERRFRAIFDNAFQFIGLINPDGAVLKVNSTTLAVRGLKESDVLGKPFWEAPWWTHSPEMQERLRGAIKAAASGLFVRFETDHPLPDGTIMYVDFSLQPIKDEAGNVVYLIPEGREITDRKLAEEALRQSENTARALLNAPTDPAVLLDPDGKILAFNMAAREFARREGRLQDQLDEAVVGRLVFDFMPRDVVETRKRRLLQVVRSGKPARFEDESLGRFYDHNFYPVLDARGQVAQVAVFMRDITDYKLAMARIEERTLELTESEEKYRTLVENVPLVVYRMKPNGEILFVNQAVETIFGDCPEQILRHPGLWDQRIYEEDRPGVKELQERSFREGREFMAEYRVKHKQGHIVYVTDHAMPLRAPDGSIGSVDGIIMDVTGRVRLQQRLVRAREIKTIREVSARLAHEIRNPLVSAGGFARRLLASMSQDDPNRTKVEIIVKEVGRLEAILRMILIYIQPLELCASPTSPNRLVETALSLVSREISEHDVKVHLRLAADLPEVCVDKAQMEHAVEILVKNALNQMRRGTTLSIATSSESEMLKVAIRYPIQEMSSENLEQFFYPFTLPQMTYEIVDLPMSKLLVDKHGGAIDVKFEETNHLLIEISLPLRTNGAAG